MLCLSCVSLRSHLGHIQSQCRVPTDLVVDMQEGTVLHKISRPGLGVFPPGAPILYGWELKRLRRPATRFGVVFDSSTATKTRVVLGLLDAFSRTQSKLNHFGPPKMISSCYKFFQQLSDSQLLKLHSRFGSSSEGGDALKRSELLIAILQHLAEVGSRNIAAWTFNVY